MEKTAFHTSALLKSALTNYQELLKEIGAQNLLTHRGVLYVWIDPRQQPNSSQINIRSESGVEQIKLSGEEIRELEPNLSDQIHGAAKASCQRARERASQVAPGDGALRAAAARARSPQPTPAIGAAVHHILPRSGVLPAS